MNMNTSGHMEVTAREEPDWYKTFGSTDRAKLSPNTLETESMQNSFTSLNLDSLTVVDLDHHAHHYSVRSLPVIGSSHLHSQHGPIASTQDAPWNESPRSLRSNPSGRPLRSVMRTTPSTPPAGVSALDHLQNSISSLAHGGGTSYLPSPPRNIITEESVEGDDDYSEDDGYETLGGSFGSLRMDDNEMDTTAHAGNVTRATSGSVSRIGLAYTPSSPQRSLSHTYVPSSPQRSSRGASVSSSYVPSSPQRSITGQFVRGGADSVASRGSRYRLHGSYNQANEPSLSTLGDDDDAEDDDDNVEIIKLLSKQVETLKKQLLDQQQQNQALQHSSMAQLNASKSSILDNFFPNDSLIQRETDTKDSGLNGKSTHSTKSFGQDYSECDSFGEDKDDYSCHSSSTNGAASSVHDKSKHALVTAQTAIFGAIAALKASLHKQQHAIVAKTPRSVPFHQDPLYDETAMDDNHDDLEDDQLLMDELVVCELEVHVKTLQRIVNHQQHGLVTSNAQLKAKVHEQAMRIAQLEAAAAAAQL